MNIEKLAQKIMSAVLAFGFCPAAKISPSMAWSMAWKCQKLADSAEDLLVELSGGRNSGFPFVSIKNGKTGKGIWINPLSTTVANFEEIRKDWQGKWGHFEDETLEKGEIKFE